MIREGMPVGTIKALYFYPVKSTAGQGLKTAAVTEQGIERDRRWAVYTADGGIASGKRTRRFRPVPGLMEWISVVEDGCAVPVVVSPDGARYRVDEPAASQALSAAFNQELTLRPESTIQHHDETPLHVVTTSSLAALGQLGGAMVDERRFRANIIIDTGDSPAFVEDDWVGSELMVGRGTVLRLGAGMPRCVMIDQPQAGVPAEPKALKILGSHHQMELGLQAHAVHTGTVKVGDVLTLRRSTN